MRIAHITDLHISREPERGDYNAKRILGYINYRLFRSRRYQEQIAEAALRLLMQNPPDLVLLTGDITQHGLDSEFEAAEKLLAIVTDAQVPVIAVAGNHDAYGNDNGKHRVGNKLPAFLRRIALDLMPDSQGIFHLPGVELAALRQDVPTPIFFSYGRQDSGELRRARSIWQDSPDGVMRIVCGHYPVIDPHGGRLLYFRGLRKAEKLIEFCRDHQVAAYFCGHNHKRFVAPMPGNCMQYVAPALSAVKGAGKEWISVYECGPGLEHPLEVRIHD